MDVKSNSVDLFNYVESELIDLSNVLSAAGTVDYGRATREAAKTLLAKVYLNAEVYSGTNRYDDCRNYCEQVINSGAFQLDMDYQHLFLADNQNSSEVIFPVVYDGLYAQTWGGTTYLVCGALGGSMNAADYGVNGKWGGLRSTSAFVNKFPDTTEDSRFLFYRDGQELEITNLGTFTQGYAYPKYKNVTSVGDVGSNNGTSAHVDIDFPMFRLADVYLMLAESAYRNGDQGTALNYVNMLRERAYGNSNNNMSSINLDDILDERSRELAWEGSRRTDLIRFGKFTSGDYVWPFKGGDVSGVGTSSHLELYPIPTSDLILNPNLTQNPGY